MTNVYWLEQTEAEVPAGNDWLGLGEVGRLNGMRFAKRRADWRLGRWTAKRAIAVCLDLPQDFRSLAEIEIRAAPTGAPEVALNNKHAAVSISLSHRSGRAVCAVVPSLVELGCDVEKIEPRSDAFATDYFAADEQALLARFAAADRSWLLTLLWSAKESALKALQEGLRLDTRSVGVRPADLSSSVGGWHPLAVWHLGGAVFYGWWQRAGGFLWTVLSAPPPNPPIRLQRSACSGKGVSLDV